MFFGAFTLAFVGGASSQVQDRWSRYEPRTIQSIIKMHDQDLPHDNFVGDQLFISADSFPSRVKLAYLAKSRPLSTKKNLVLETWRRMLKNQVPSDLNEVFSTEVLFREGTEEYWIAVQKPLLEPLPKEVKTGQVVDAYVILMGAIKVDDHWEWLFAMNEFDAP